MEQKENEGFIDPKKTDALFKGEDSFAPYPTSVSSPVIQAIDKRLLKATAVESMQKNAQQQIDMLRKQAALILKQAQAIEQRIEISARIYKADFSFEPVIGGMYHLYRKGEQEVLSLVGPTEWGSKVPYDAWVASVQLLGDKTWDILMTAE
jgi:hypothetical protein